MERKTRSPDQGTSEAQASPIHACAAGCCPSWGCRAVGSCGLALAAATGSAGILLGGFKALDLDELGELRDLLRLTLAVSLEVTLLGARSSRLVLVLLLGALLEVLAILAAVVVGLANTFSA